MEIDAEDLNAIRSLRKDPHFQGYFVRRLEEKVEQSALKILENERLGGEELERERIRRWTLLEVLRMIDDDHRAIVGKG